MKLSKKINQHIKFTTSPDSPNTILEFLQSHSTGVLATTGGFNNPHAAAIYYTVDNNFDIIFATKSATQKYENMQKNNNISLVVFDTYTQTTVQITGKVVEAVSEEDVHSAIANMLHSAQQTSEEGNPPISKLYAGHYVAMRIIPQTIRMAIFLRPDPGGYDIFETIEFNRDE